MKGKFNFMVYFALYLIVFVICFVTMLLYEGIKMETSDYGSIGNFVILGLAEILQFPFLIIVRPSSDLVFFLCQFLNLAFYTGLIYFVLKVILKRMRRD